MTVDELIDDHVSLLQCEKAVKALHSHQTKRTTERQENELLPEKEENIWLTLTVKKVSPTLKIKPVRIPIRYPIVDPRTTPVCLITKDPQREYKDLLEAHKIKFISRVVGLEKLKGKFRPYEARRLLMKENGLFLADKRVIPLLPKLLGVKWFEAKKQPIPVSLDKKDLKTELERAISSTYMNQNRGTCTSVRIGTLSQEPVHIVENLKKALPAIVQHIKDGWDNIQNLAIKTNRSASLPIWSCSLGDEKEGRWDGLTAEVQSEEGNPGEEEPQLAPQTSKPHSKEHAAKSKKRTSEGEKDEEKPKKKAKKVEDVPSSQKAPIPSSDSVKGAQLKRKAKKKEGKEAVSKGKTKTLPAEPLSKKTRSPKNEEPLKAEETERHTARVDASKDDSEKVKKPKQAQVPGSAVTKADLKLKRMKDVGQKKKERVVSSRGSKSIKDAITGKKAARD